MTNGNEEGGRKAMENCLQKDPDINVVYTINEPAAAGAYEALKAVGKEKDVLVVSVDGGCPGVKNVAEGVIGATSQQYPLLMASMGIEAIKKFADTGEKPEPTEGKNSSTPAPCWSPTSRSTASSRSTPRPAWRSAGAEPSLEHSPKAGAALGPPRPEAAGAPDRNCGEDTDGRRQDPADPGIREGPEGQRHRGRRPSSAHDKPLLERAPALPALQSGAGAADRAGAVGRLIFGLILGAKFFSPFSLTLILQQVAIVGIVGAAQTLVILTAGIDLSVGAIMVLSLGGHGPVHLPLRHAGAALDPLRLRRRRADRLAQRLPRSPRCKLPPFIVTLGMWQIVLAANFLYSAQRDDPQPGHRGPGAAAAALRPWQDRQRGR